MACRTTSNCSKLDALGRSGSLHLVAQGRVDALARELGDGGESVFLALGPSQQPGQTRHIGVIAQGTQARIAAPRTSPWLWLQQIEHGRPGSRIAPLGQRSQQTHLGIRPQLGQEGGEAASGLGTFCGGANLLQTEGANVLVLIGKERAYCLHGIIIAPGRPHDWLTQDQEECEGNRREKADAGDVHGEDNGKSIR